MPKTENHLPLEYFNKLLEYNDYEKRKNVAISSMVELYGDYVNTVDYDKGIVTFWFTSNEGLISKPEVELYTSTFSENFINTIKEEGDSAKSNIDKFVIEIAKENKSSKTFLDHQIKHLNFLIERADSIYPDIELIGRTLQEIIAYLIERYSLKKVTFDIPDKFSFFDLKSNIRMPLLSEIYDATIDLGVFDDEVVTEDTFTSVFTGDPLKNKNSIIFKCDNQIAVHFINSIMPIFNNFTYSQISKSKSFFKKGGKPFNQADLDTANSRLKKSLRLTSKKEQLSSIVNEILENHLT